MSERPEFLRWSDSQTARLASLLARLEAVQRALDAEYSTQHNRRHANRPIASNRPVSAPLHMGELIVCLITRSDRQREVLGDFEELFNTLWAPKFGPRLAKYIYIAQAARSAIAAVGIGTFAAIMGRLWGILGR